MKFCKGRFAINKKYAEELRNKIDVFEAEIRNKKTLQLTFVTTKGVERNGHSNVVTNEVLLDDLFACT